MPLCEINYCKFVRAFVVLLCKTSPSLSVHTRRLPLTPIAYRSPSRCTKIADLLEKDGVGCSRRSTKDYCILEKFWGIAKYPRLPAERNIITAVFLKNMRLLRIF